jgi:hypothetical protein
MNETKNQNEFEAELKKKDYVGFEVLAFVIIKSYIFWDITPCILSKINQRFGGTCLHL